MNYKNAHLITFVLFVMVFIAALIKPAFCDSETDNKLEEKIKLTISVESKNKDKIVLNANFENITDQPVKFYLESCDICFWTYSINNDRYWPLATALHCTLCGYKNLVVLEPGQSISQKKTVFFHSMYKKTPVKTIRIKYLYSRKPENTYLESNLLNL